MLLVIGVWLPGLPSCADPIQPLLVAAHERNYARVEELIRNAPDGTAQRDLVWALAGTDPATVTFTKSWTEADRDNPVALTARAWSLYWAASIVRGDRVRRHTWPPLLDRAQEMRREALVLATRAVGLDPGFLPASDAVILINAYSGNGEAALVELARIMALDPNRHSLVATTSALTPAWGGSVELMQAVCGHYAPQVAEVPNYTADLCLAQAALRGWLQGDIANWAIAEASRHADQPFLERELMRLAREHRLSPEAVASFAAHLKSVGRMSVHVTLAPQEGYLQSYDLPDRAGFAATLADDLAQASAAADRDPANVEALVDLVDLYRIQVDFEGAPILHKPDVTDADRAETADRIQGLLAIQGTDLDRRARRVLDLAPANVKAIDFALQHVMNPYPDPVDTDRWALALLTNAALYANYQETQLGRVAVESQARYTVLRGRVGSGELAAYDQSVLDEVYLCPYVRAVRLVDEVCAQHPNGEEYCVLEAVREYPSPSQQENSLFIEIANREACAAERGAPVESLLYDPVAVPPLP